MPTALVLPRSFPERFAVEWGHDEYGIFMGFGVGHVEQRIVQRMRWIAPGSFLMGSPATEVGRNKDEVQHQVELTQGYWLADTPVTQALWEAVMGTNPSRFKGPHNPVEQVNWDDCQEFLQRLNERVEGLHARLPTEAEWEYACRAGTKTATWAGELELIERGRGPRELTEPSLLLKERGVKAQWLDPIAWRYANAGGTTHPVAQKQSNPWGLYDMLGNVDEWCADWLAPYDAKTLQDPRGPTGGTERVKRGGSFWRPARNMRAAYRASDPPDMRSNTPGFRLARGPAPSKDSKRGAPPSKSLRTLVAVGT